ncbi:molybdopterin-binding domain-containing protein [Roseimaritima ulvae]|uniref:Formyltransferase/hydrolase complex Fhc subunit B n=1 Tax=Roseimaritima ulvae TaxID=980254 RepID=A0A5B9QNJ8_9BACT|nr:hypothetical protein [Roseimaritima ulvae]QEG40544.1 hypothetical protein UC8_25590 [Roseimaritima ulvae]
MLLPWTCSICALRCDDVLLERAPQGIAVRPDCGLASEWIERLASGPRRKPAVRGREVTWEAALAAARSIVQDANRLAIRGSTPDVQTARAACELAAAAGAVLDFVSPPAAHTLAAAVSRDGLTTATLGDVRQHADRIVRIGRPNRRWPRLDERFTAGKPTLAVLPAIANHTAEASAAERQTQENLAQEDQTTADANTLCLQTGWLDWLRSVLLQLQTSPAQHTDVSPAAERLISFLRGGRYIALIIADDAWSGGEDAESGSWWLRLVERLGRDARCVLLLPDTNAAVRQTLLWRTGFSGPVTFSQHTPSLSPVAARCDAAVQLCPSFAATPASGAEPDSVDAGLPTVLLGDHATPDASIESAAVFLPVGWAGIDHAGTTVRGDGTVTLGLQPLPDTVLPHPNPHRAADVLAEFTNAIAHQERA